MSSPSYTPASPSSTLPYSPDSPVYFPSSPSTWPEEEHPYSPSDPRGFCFAPQNRSPSPPLSVVDKYGNTIKESEDDIQLLYKQYRCVLFPSFLANRATFYPLPSRKDLPILYRAGQRGGRIREAQERGRVQESEGRIKTNSH
jgi:hypothetical protein